jgi:hypothetical protein
MPSLAGSLLSLTSLVGTLGELGIVKKHLLQASREILLAVQGLLEFADDYVSNLSSSADHQQTLRAAINYAHKTIRLVANQLPRGDDEAYRALHRKVMNSILEVIEAEIRKNTRQKSQKAQMKVEVFEAIRNVLLRETYERESRAATKPRSEKKHDQPI